MKWKIKLESCVPAEEVQDFLDTASLIYRTMDLEYSTGIVLEIDVDTKLLINIPRWNTTDKSILVAFVEETEVDLETREKNFTEELSLTLEKVAKGKMESGEAYQQILELIDLRR